jgi:hypothetical protein
MEYRMSVPEMHARTILCVAYNPYRREIYTGSEGKLLTKTPRATVSLNSIPNRHNYQSLGKRFWKTIKHVAGTCGMADHLVILVCKSKPFPLWACQSCTKRDNLKVKS